MTLRTFSEFDEENNLEPLNDQNSGERILVRNRFTDAEPLAPHGHGVRNFQSNPFSRTYLIINDPNMEDNFMMFDDFAAAS